MPEIENSAIDFDTARCSSGEYFMYVIQNGEHSGGGTSCYFWFSSPAQLLNSIKHHMDFWEWRDGWEKASDDLTKIIDIYGTQKLSDGLRADIDDYIYKNAHLNIYGWGSLSDLTTSDGKLFADIRKDFREEAIHRDNENDETGVDAAKSSRPISLDEMASFIEFISTEPT